MLVSKLREGWKKGKPAFGFWAALPSAFATELMAAPGLDYLCVDQQHGVIDYNDAVQMFAATQGARRCPAYARSANQAWMIGKSLDAGAQGVVVPLVNNRADAAAAVSACRYPPNGIRSFGPHARGGRCWCVSLEVGGGRTLFRDG